MKYEQKVWNLCLLGMTFIVAFIAIFPELQTVHLGLAIISSFLMYVFETKKILKAYTVPLWLWGLCVVVLVIITVLDGVYELFENDTYMIITLILISRTFVKLIWGKLAGI